MDRSKNNLIKSKSSNTTVKPRTRREHKKSRSNAEIKPYTLKKRGVYVEKKPTKISFNGPRNTNPIKIRCPPRPNQRIINSVANILSQNTAGTQCPDSLPHSTKHHDNNTLNLNKQYVSIEEIIAKKKQIYRSRVLNKIENDLNEIVVLQSKKNISCSPSSNYTDISRNEPEFAEWSDVLPGLETKLNSDEDDGGTFRVDAPSEATLVAEDVKKDDKKIYNFFVDLLETTFDVYNVKTEFDTAPQTNTTSLHDNLKIDETVAKKLNMVKFKNKLGDSNYTLFKSRPNFVTPYKSNNKIDDVSRNMSVMTINMNDRRRKFKSISINRKRRPSKVVSHNLTFEKPLNGKKLLKKEQKKTLLNLLKKQINADNGKHMKPQSFFQALKLMAKNKVRSEISTQLTEPSKHGTRDNDNKCRFKRRRLLPRINKKSDASAFNSKTFGVYSQNPTIANIR